MCGSRLNHPHAPDAACPRPLIYPLLIRHQNPREDSIRGFMCSYLPKTPSNNILIRISLSWHMKITQCHSPLASIFDRGELVWVCGGSHKLPRYSGLTMALSEIIWMYPGSLYDPMYWVINRRQMKFKLFIMKVTRDIWRQFPNGCRGWQREAE